ncbi:MAG: class I tRNA ligase family protein, partial [Solirubrobacterales bacterium]
YYAKSSWYIRTTDVRDRMLAANEEIDWHPAHIKHGRFGKWLEGNVDWALSRERYWGTPLPIWECESAECEERFCAGSMAELRERGGELPDDLHRPYIDEVVLRCNACGGEMRRVEEVIDAWYDSGSMPFAQFHYPFEGKESFEERFPAEFICEGIDQTRGWFYSLLAVSVLLFDTTSYRHCVCLGLILDPEGQKMSTSRGNVVEPGDVIDRHGADALRWYYLTSQQPWAGYRFSVETVGEAVRQFTLTLWNTYSFWVLYANAEGLEPKDFSESAVSSQQPAEDETLDRWVVSRLQATIREVIDRLEHFDSTAAGRAIASYVDELSNWYVRLSRRRFWEGDRAAFGTLRRCLLDVAALLAPFTPFLSDEMYGNLAGGEREEFGSEPDSVHLLDYPEPDESLADADLELGMEAARRAVELGRAARSQAGVKVRQPLRKAVIVATDSEREEIERLSELVAGELNVKELEFVAEEAELVTYEVKPNYRSLGPRFGSQMPQAAAAVQALDPAAVAEAVAGERTVGIQVNGAEHELAPEDVTLVLQPLDGYQVEAESGRAVALALELDDELRREGLAREVVHAVQSARRDAGLEVTVRIELLLGGDGELLDAARAHENYVAGETLARSVGYEAVDGATASIEGRELRIDLAPS